MMFISCLDESEMRLTGRGRIHSSGYENRKSAPAFPPNLSPYLPGTVGAALLFEITGTAGLIEASLASNILGELEPVLFESFFKMNAPLPSPITKTKSIEATINPVRVREDLRGELSWP